MGMMQTQHFAHMCRLAGGMDPLVSVVIPNYNGAPGVHGQEFADVDSYGVERWLGELALALNASLQVLLHSSSAMYNTGADALTSIPWAAAFIFWSPSLPKG
jgi:hypothetical protein